LYWRSSSSSSSTGGGGAVTYTSPPWVRHTVCLPPHATSLGPSAVSHGSTVGVANLVSRASLEIWLKKFWPKPSASRDIAVPAARACDSSGRCGLGVVSGM